MRGLAGPSTTGTAGEFKIKSRVEQNRELMGRFAGPLCPVFPEMMSEDAKFALGF
jgi:hypothetical protein